MAEKDLNDLFLDTLKDIYYAEKHILKALPKMAKAANSEELSAAFEKHYDETEGQVARLEQIFELLGKPARGKKEDPAAQTFRDYFDFHEPVRKIPPHRVLALRRGAAEKLLTVGIDLPVEPLEVDVAPLVPIARGKAPASAEVAAAAKDALERLVLPSLERELIGELEDVADRAADVAMHEVAPAVAQAAHQVAAGVGDPAGQIMAGADRAMRQIGSRVRLSADPVLAGVQGTAGKLTNS